MATKIQTWLHREEKIAVQQGHLEATLSKQVKGSARVKGNDMLFLLTALFGFKSSQITFIFDVTLLLWLHLLGPQDEDLHKEANDRIEGLERHHSNISKDLGRWAKEQMTGYGLPTCLF